MKRNRIRADVNWPRGEVMVLKHHSEVLADNPWNDPVDRNVCVYLPPGYDPSADPLPALWDLVGYTGAGPSHIAWRGFADNVPARMDRLIAQGKMGPAVVVFPDCFTSLGGNQYINSAAVGRYADYVMQELIPFVAKHVNVGAGPAQRAVFGKSSGGYAATIYAMRYPEYWGAAANHSGDACFDLVYKRDFPVVAQELAKFDGDMLKFLTNFWKAKRHTGDQIHALMLICMAATYAPDGSKDLGFELPFDLHTLELKDELWARWLEHDPINLVDQSVENLRQLKGFYMDCGHRDQYLIHFGCRILHKKLVDLEIAHTYEEFDGTHSGVDYRMDESLPFLYRALALSGIDSIGHQQVKTDD